MASDIPQHRLVPLHIKLSEEEKQQILDSKGLEFLQLPKILKNDPAITHLEAKEGDVIKIERKSHTVGTAVYYRVVING